MKLYFSDIKKKSGLIIRTFLFVVVSMFIVFLLPREGKFQYEFQKGSPWKHENLIANYDFPVYKPDIEIKKENDSIIADFTPYFSYNQQLSSNLIIELQKDLDKIIISKLQKDSTDYGIKSKKYKAKKDSLTKFCLKANKILNNIYSDGIIDYSDISQNSISDNKKIIILKEKIGEESSINKTYTPKEAYSKISNLMIKEFSPENKEINYPIINYSNYLKSNLTYNTQISDKILS